MNPLLLYAIKVILCSGVLLGYYWLALRNKIFHQWNRFYLLACVVLSLAAPLLKIHIGNTTTQAPTGVLHILNAVNADSVVEIESRSNSMFSFTPEQWTTLGYLLISLILLSVIIANGVRIYNLLRAYPKTKLGDICFLNTTADGTPFSFFQYIVWNEAIDLNSENGQRIFQHEMVHVQQRHTWDKVFLLFLLVPFWINPFFWLIRKELCALHEFAADEKSMQPGDATTLAQLILNTTFPEQHFLFTNPFFQSTIKRRLAMFTKLQNPKMSYWSRIIALPVLLIVIASFALRTKPVSTNTFAALSKPITVIIDAGHGGDEDGATFENIQEKDIALAIAKQVQEQNRDANIKIILTRESDVKTDLKSRVQMAADKKADLFLSIHVNAADVQSPQQFQTSLDGMQVVVSGKNPSYQAQSELLGSALVQALKKVYNTQAGLIKPNSGVWVLDNNVCPAVLIECGYLTDKKDRDFITQNKNQILIANKILEAIAQYAVLKNDKETSFARDTGSSRMYNNKALSDVQYFEWPKKEVHLFFADGTKDTISYTDAKAANLFDTAAISTIERKSWAIEKVAETNLATGDLTVRKASLEEAQNFKGVIVLDNKVFSTTYQQLTKLKNEIAYISVVKGTAFGEELGIKMKPNDSLLAISTKAFIKANQHTDNEPLFTQPEVDAMFPGGGEGWQKFLQQTLDATVPVKEGAKPGSYKVIVGFIVDKNGKLYDMKPVTHFGHGMEDEVMRILKLSPDWKPAMQNGQTVTSYRKQPVTFMVSEAKAG